MLDSKTSHKLMTGLDWALNNKMNRCPVPTKMGFFAYFRLKAPTVGLALEKSRSHASAALRNAFELGFRV